MWSGHNREKSIMGQESEWDAICKQNKKGGVVYRPVSCTGHQQLQQGGPLIHYQPSPSQEWKCNICAVPENGHYWQHTLAEVEFHGFHQFCSAFCNGDTSVNFR